VNPLADIENICFVDFETRALPGTSDNDGNVKDAGTYRYAKNSFAIISTWAIGNGPVFDLALSDFATGPLKWSDTPPDLRAFYGRVANDEAWFAAFNAGFDRNVWNAIPSFPKLLPEHMIDIMAQAAASNLPPALEGVARALGLGGKQADGKALIKLFCSADGGTPQSHPDEWRRFKAYARQDTALLQEIFKRTRALPFSEWREYWASERINERGVAIDLHFVERAAAVAEAEKKRINSQLSRWSNGQVTAVTQVARLADWIHNRLDTAEAREILVSEAVEDADSDEDWETDKLSLARARVERLLAYYATRHPLSEHDQLTVDVLNTRLFGGSTSPFKFRKMLDQHDGGLLKGQYVFSGAAQTQRFSSKGVQVHNLTRQTLGKHEAAAIEMINELKL
jgi:DNA polymerase